MKNNIFAFFVCWLAYMVAGPVWAQSLSISASPSVCTGNGWSNPNNANARDARYATLANDSTVASSVLRCSGFGFAIPPSATINGIVVSITRKTSVATANTVDASVQVMKGGVAQGANLSTTALYNETDVTMDHGSAVSLWWSFWNPAEINSANFGVSYAFKKGNAAAPAQTVSVDQIRVTVYYTAFQCRQPGNIPADLALTCLCDTFERTNLQPSTIYNSNYLLTTSDNTGILPGITIPGYLRLTNASFSNAKSVSVPGVFPAAGNYLSLEFNHYAWGGHPSGADGMVAVLSDYAIPPQAGGGGGSLGYPPLLSNPGFAGGWLGVALDEYGNYSQGAEGRNGGPGNRPQSVGIRGSGSGTAGYAWLAGALQLGRGNYLLGIDNFRSQVPSFGYRYQVVVDARNNNGVSGPVMVSVNRDTSGGGTRYEPLIAPFNVYAVSANQQQMPANFRVSFTAGTGSAYNVHEIGALRICAAPFDPPPDGAIGAFNTIEPSYSANTANALQGHIFTKLAGTGFALRVAAINNTSSGILTSYAAAGTRNVTVDLIDDSVGTSCNVSVAACSACSKPVVATQTVAFVAADKGFKLSPTFTVSRAYKRLVARATDGVGTGCSTDAFSVRPLSFATPASSASNATLMGAPSFKAGTDRFNVTVTTTTPGYTGTPKINAAALQANSTAWTPGTLSPTTFGAASATTSTASGSFTYSEVGNFKLLGYPATNATAARGIYDDTWTAVDQGVQNDCVAGSYANTLNAGGKYGCLFGIVADTPLMGRFVPNHFALTAGSVTPWSNGFTWMGQPALGLAWQLEARNGANATTANYSQALGYPVSNPVLVAEDNTAANAGCDLASRISGLPAASWAGGTYTVAGTATFSRPTAVGVLDKTRCSATAATATGPFTALDIGIAMTDSDAGARLTQPGYTMNAGTAGDCAASGNCTATRLGSSALLWGRVKLGNAYGSPSLPLSVPLEVQYWSGTAWLRNTNDNQTQLVAPATTTLAAGASPGGTPGLYFYPTTAKNLLVSAATKASATSVRVVAGAAAITLTPPGPAMPGWLDMVLPVPTWLPGNWGNCMGQTGPANLADDYPCARINFGIYKNRLLFRRENY